ncbi:MAG TPA: energy-coupling factor transporter ATPase [Treponemataceae bacterium]|nr:energy-coupling factor transporter ATPase [Treponemataceae bacterium]
MPEFFVKNVTFSYPDSGIKAIKNVSFSIRSGQYIAVLGANGSGKSTLARLLTGFLEPDSGSITVDALTGIVFQSPRDQIIAETLERDTAFGCENLDCTDAETENRVVDCLTLIDLLSRRSEKVTTLSLGQKQKLALAGILALSPEVLVLDEAVSMVDPEMRYLILDYLDTWHTASRTIVHITHDIEEAMRAQRIIAIDDGAIVFDGTCKEFCAHKDISEKMFGVAPASLRNKTIVPERGIGKNAQSKIGLLMQDVSFVYDKEDRHIHGGVHNISLAFDQGSLTALMGASGSGKSTILELAMGLLIPDSGKITAVSTPKNSDSRPVLALQETESALFEQFAADDVAFGPRNQGLAGKKLKDQVRLAMDTAAVPFDTYAERRTYTLSGGEKRKVALAGIIAMRSNVYLFDEPTAGLDPKSRHQVMNMLAALAAAGKTVVFSTHRNEEGDFAHRCIKLIDGKIINDTNPIQTSNLKQKSNYNLVNVEAENVSMLDGLRQTSKGLYSKKKSLVHNLNPIVKYLVFLAVFMTGIVVQNISMLCGIVILSLVYVMSAKYSLLTLFKTFVKFLPWIALFAGFQFLLFPAQEGEIIYWSWKCISISPSKLQLVLKTMLHVAAALSAITAFLYSTEETEILDGLQMLCSPLDKMGLKSKYVAMTASLIFRFVPLLADEAVQIIKVQIIRGGLKTAKGPLQKTKNLLPLFVPLIVQTFKRAEAVGDTLDARYF